jgi:hypothetical protein
MHIYGVHICYVRTDAHTYAEHAPTHPFVPVSFFLLGLFLACFLPCVVTETRGRGKPWNGEERAGRGGEGGNIGCLSVVCMKVR